MSSELLVKELEEAVINEGARRGKVPLHALVIGIDKYLNHRELSGAVADANAVDTYLRRHLNVPENQICNLRDEQATRVAIIEAFMALGENPDIDPADPIFIYYAGHGSEQEAPSGWDTGGEKIQVIIPRDAGLTISTGQQIPSIPDLTVAALLGNLADKKGNNITVVFDCCHATSGTRDDRNVPGRFARVSDVQHPLSLEWDHEIIGRPGKARQMKISTGFAQRGVRSHVLMAACDAKEKAWETDGRGVFTTALLETVIAIGAGNVTYTGIIERFPSLPMQHPRCEGLNMDRILFPPTVQQADRGLVDIMQRGDIYILSAGIAAGIVVGSEFAVYTDRESLSKPPLCTLRVKATEVSCSTLEPLDNTPTYTLAKPAYARQVRRGPGNELRVHLTNAFMGVVDVNEVRPDGVDIGFVFTTRDQAELVVDVDVKADGNTIVFSTTNSSATAYGIAQLPHFMPPEAGAISHVLRSAARWNWHLNRTNTNIRRVSKMVDLEFYRLRQVDGDYDRQGLPILEPMGENMNRTGVIQLVANPAHFFGFKIVNHGTRPLYPHLFYFDISDQSIAPYYLPSPSGKCIVDPPLRPRSNLTIGYGATGGVPLAFELRGSQKVEIGFLKLFLTTTQTDFGSLAQDSPFGSTRAQLPKNDVMRKLQTMDLWGTVMVNIVQCAEP